MTRHAVVLALLGCASAMAAAPRPAVEVVTTDHVDLAPGGTIHIEHSRGDLTVEGWDEPRVEITVTRMTFPAHDTGDARDLATRELKSIQVSQSKSGEKDLTISTPSRKRWSQVNLSYRIMVPRSASLVIHHGMGDVLIGNVAGDIDASVKAGDILLRLPGGGNYAFDARCSEGTVVSDFTGSYTRRYLIGEKYSAAGTAGASHHRLHVGIGAIGIQDIPAK